MTDTTPPLEPLGLDEVKLNLRVNGTAEDDLIEGLIVDAREFVERETGLVLVPRILTETAQRLGRWIDLTSWPVNTIVEIRYPAAGIMTSLPGSAWQTSLKRRPVRIVPTSFGGWGVVGWSGLAVPSLPIEIDVDAGYTDPTAIPRGATRAMHMLIAHWYANRATAEVGTRAAAIEVPFGATALCNQLRLTRI